MNVHPSPTLREQAATQTFGWRFLLSRRWLGYFALLFAFSVICAWLGNWQFDRRAQARTEIARIDANYDAAPVSLAEAVPNPMAFNEDERKWQQVTLHGRYLDQVFLARNRPGPGGVGSHMLQAFRNDDGSLFIVDRGWVPVSGESAAVDRETLEAILPAAPAAEVTVIARLRASEPRITGRSAAGRSLASIHLPELIQLADFETLRPTPIVYAAAYGQLVTEHPSADTGVLPERPARDEGPHLSYALQWYVFIIIAAAGFCYGAKQEYRRLNGAHEPASISDTPGNNRWRFGAVRPPLKALSDAEAEDAILDADTVQ